MKSLWIATLLFCSGLPVPAHASPEPGSPVVFFEIYVSDVQKAKAFYGELLGWHFVPTPNYPQMWQVVPPTGGTAGALIEHEGRVNKSWGTIVYVHVDKIQLSVALAKKLGASVEVPVGVIQGVGSITLMRDLDQNIFGMISDEGK